MSNRVSTASEIRQWFIEKMILIFGGVNRNPLEVPPGAIVYRFIPRSDLPEFCNARKGWEKPEEIDSRFNDLPVRCPKDSPNYCVVCRPPGSEVPQYLPEPQLSEFCRKLIAALVESASITEDRRRERWLVSQAFSYLRYGSHAPETTRGNVTEDNMIARLDQRTPVTSFWSEYAWRKGDPQQPANKCPHGVYHGQDGHCSVCCPIEVDASTVSAVRRYPKRDSQSLKTLPRYKVLEPKDKSRTAFQEYEKQRLREENAHVNTEDKTHASDKTDAVRFYESLPYKTRTTYWFAGAGIVRAVSEMVHSAEDSALARLQQEHAAEQSLKLQRTTVRRYLRPIPARQRKVAKLQAQGYTLNEIAAQIGKSRRTAASDLAKFRKTEKTKFHTAATG